MLTVPKVPFETLDAAKGTFGTLTVLKVPFAAFGLGVWGQPRLSVPKVSQRFGSPLS
jgi:hypothetical protein